MVCEKCEVKLTKIITPDTWKEGARNTLESGGRLINENKLLTQKSNLLIATGSSKVSQYKDCRICKLKLHQLGAYYCQQCSYKKGICSMCGVKIAKVAQYNQSSA